MARHCRPCFLACGIALLLAGAPGTARADFAVTDLRINVETTGIAVNQVYGWEFTPTTAITVSELGWFDAGANGLLAAHEIGIFNAATQQLLASATIPAGTAAPIQGPAVVNFFAPTITVGAFRYVDISPVALAAGQHYIVAGFVPSSPLDPLADSSPQSPALRQFAPEVTFVQGRAKYFGNPQGLAFPTDEQGSDFASFGATFQFTPAVAVPEPSSLLLALSGCGGVLGWACLGRKRQ